MDKRKYTVEIKKDALEHIEILGGKAEGLIELMSMDMDGVDVPEGFVLTTHAYQSFLEENDISQKVDSLTQLITEHIRNGIQGMEDEALKRQILDSASCISGMITRGRISAELRKEIAHSYYLLAGSKSDSGRSAVAVRSSCTLEDSADMSFAGRYSSFLNQKALTQLLNSIQACWASNFSGGVLEYILKVAEATISYPKMAVIVQRMIDPKVSGVGYNTDLETGEDLICFAMNYGLGESIVGGSISPDIFKVNIQEGEIVERILGSKEEQYVCKADGGTQKCPVAISDRQRFAVSSNQVLDIAKLIHKIGIAYENRKSIPHVDTEFVIDSEGRIYFLQVRPESVTKTETFLRVRRDARTGAVYHLDGIVANNRGAVSGRAVIISGATDLSASIEEAERRLREGGRSILITRATNLDWNVALMHADAIIVDNGNYHCHAAKVARELGIPCICGTGNATDLLKHLDNQLVTLEAHTLTLYEGALPLEETSREEIEKEEEELEWQKEKAALLLSAEDEKRKAIDANKRRGIVVEDQDGVWMQNPPYHYGQFQFQVYTIGWQRLSSLLGIPLRVRKMTGILVTELNDLTNMGELLKTKDISELESIFAERRENLSSWLRTCGDLEMTVTGIESLIEDWAKMLVYTHMGFEYARALQWHISKEKTCLTDEQRLAFKRYYARLTDFEMASALKDAQEQYFELLKEARKCQQHFDPDDLERVKRNLERYSPELWARIVQYSRTMQLAEKEDVRLSCDTSLTLAQLKQDLKKAFSRFYSPVAPSFPSELADLPNAERLERLAVLSARVAAHKERQHFLLVRGGQQIREIFMAQGAKWVEAGVLEDPTDIFELTIDQMRMLVEGKPISRPKPLMGNVVALIMAGGRGSRLWPISTEERPKQFLRLISERTMLQMTVDRLSPLIPIDRVFICTSKQYSGFVKDQLPDLPDENILLEPEARDTTAAIGYSSLIIENRAPGATVILLSADHDIRGLESFRESIKTCTQIAQTGNYLVSIGIPATEANTGYGYMECGSRTLHSKDAFYGVSYREKPNRDAAAAYVLAGNHLWNSGIFVWENKQILQAIELYQPAVFEKLAKIRDLRKQLVDASEVIGRAYAEIPRISIDNGVMEAVRLGDKFENIFFRGGFQWSDIGSSFAALAQAVGLDEDGNALRGSVVIDNPKSVRNSILFAEAPMRIKAKGIFQTIVAVNSRREAIILPTSDEQKIKDLVKLPVEYGLSGLDENRNLIRAPVKLLNVKRSLFETDRTGVICAIGISDMVVVIKDNTLLIYDLAYLDTGTGVSRNVAAMDNPTPSCGMSL